MEDHIVKLEQISKKARALVEQFHSLQEKCTDLEDQNKKLKDQFESKVSQNKELNENLKLVQISGKLKNGKEQDSTELKKKINEFIKEIDRCVAMLNN